MKMHEQTGSTDQLEMCASRTVCLYSLHQTARVACSPSIAVFCELGSAGKYREMMKSVSRSSQGQFHSHAASCILQQTVVQCLAAHCSKLAVFTQNPPAVWQASCSSTAVSLKAPDFVRLIEVIHVCSLPLFLISILYILVWICMFQVRNT